MGFLFTFMSTYIIRTPIMIVIYIYIVIYRLRTLAESERGKYKRIYLMDFKRRKKAATGDKPLYLMHLRPFRRARNIRRRLFSYFDLMATGRLRTKTLCHEVTEIAADQRKIFFDASENRTLFDFTL